ncbi:hypothetical protein BKA63DRAFT_495050 [Paraphoma chrysanthemicola]|nr:hypothetical protein BKA63DRAFT_495050 [Paraphoma chrysanthemicola]
MPSFFSVPAELRIQIYSHLLPGPDQYPSVYTGLRNSCRLIRKEYDNEAEEVIPHTYDHSPLRLNRWWHIAHAPSDPRTILDISTVEIQPTPRIVTCLAHFPPNIIPWHWTWVKTLIISFGMSSESRYHHQHILNIEDGVNDHYESDEDTKFVIWNKTLKGPANRPIQSAVNVAFERMDKFIKDRTGTTVDRRTFTKGDRRCRECEIDTFVMRLVDFDEGDVTPPHVILPPEDGMPSNHDRLWDVTFGVNRDGGLVEAIWRRRTRFDAQRDAENDFMPPYEWLAPAHTCPEPLDPLEEFGAPGQRIASLWDFFKR